MPREVDEWIGPKDDTDAPPRVRVRVFNKYGGVCQCGCTRRIQAGEPWQLDHIVALINGGENRESNVWPLLTAHHKEKSKNDMAEKSTIYKKRSRHLGLKKRSRFPCSKTSKFKKKFDGTVVRR